MPEAQRVIERWFKVGRVLPREVRERIFEPAFYDAARAWLGLRRAGIRTPLAHHALWTVLRCAPIALPRLVVNQGRLTRLGRITVAVAAVGASVLVVLVIVLRSYVNY